MQGILKLQSCKKTVGREVDIEHTTNRMAFCNSPFDLTIVHYGNVKCLAVPISTLNTSICLREKGGAVVLYLCMLLL